MTLRVERSKRIWWMTPGGFVASAILWTAFGAVFSVFIVWKDSRSGLGRMLLALNLALSILLIWTAAIASYRRVKRAIVSSTASDELLAAVQYHGAFTLSTVCMAWMIVVMNTLLLR